MSAIVLAGGASSRMGFNKALATIGPESDSTTLIAQAVAFAKQFSSDVIISANDREAYGRLGALVIRDVYPSGGSLGGIYSGLLAAQHDRALVVACDMPFLSRPLWRHMLDLPRDYDVLMPRVGGHLEPLHAVYGKRCLGPMRELLERDHLRIIDFLDQVRARFLDEQEVDRFDPTHRSFFNVNTPEQLSEALSLVDRGQHRKGRADAKS